MKALIVLNLEDCTFDEIDEAEIKEISLVYQDKETGKKYDFLWETGFKIVPMPQRKIVGEIEKVDDFMKSDIQIINEKVTAKIMLDTELLIASGYNLCIDEILGEE